MEVARRISVILALIGLAGIAWVVADGRASSIAAQVILGTALACIPALLKLSLPDRLSLIWVQLAGISVWWEPDRSFEMIFASAVIPAALFRAIVWIVSGARRKS